MPKKTISSNKAALRFAKSDLLREASEWIEYSNFDDNRVYTKQQYESQKKVVKKLLEKMADRIENKTYNYKIATHVKRNNSNRMP